MIKPNAIFNSLLSFAGWKTNRKLIVITSDDWGGIRVESAAARSNLISEGINMNANRFDKYDTLEMNTDMEQLYSVLKSYKDSKGNYAVFTPLVNVANPDFSKIENSGFKEYHYEIFTETLGRSEERDKVFLYYKEGIKKNIFVPEFHGREHINIAVWMKALVQDNKITKKGFKYHFPFVTDENNSELRKGYAYAFDGVDSLSQKEEVIKDGLKIFESLFNYKATFFTAPSMIYNRELERQLHDSNIKIIDVPKLQKLPVGDNKYKKRLTYFGKKNKFGQKYINRNAVFEPNISDNNDGVDNCINKIAEAFKQNKPAVISNHRAAFCGGIDTANREKGINSLDKLLKTILIKWPDAEFISMRELNEIMSQ